MKQKTKGPHLALVAASADDVLLTGAFSGDFIASAVVEGAECVASASLTPFGIVHVAIPETSLASGGRVEIETILSVGFSVLRYFCLCISL